MNPISRLLLIFSLFSTCVVGQNIDQVPPIDEIEKMIQRGRKNADFKILAEAYYLEAVSNMQASLHGKEVEESLNRSASHHWYLRDTTSFHIAKMKLAEVYIYKQIFYEEGLDILKNALSHFKEKSLEKHQATAYGLISKIHDQRQDYALALENITAALTLNKVVKDSILEVKNGIILSKLLADQGKVEKGIEIVKINIERAQALGQNLLVGEGLLELAQYQMLLQKMDSAIIYLDQALQYIPDKSRSQALAYSLLSDAYKKTENYHYALDYQSKYADLNEDLLNNERTEIINRQSIVHGIREKEREIDQLEREKEFSHNTLQQQQRLSWALGGAFIIGLIALFYIIRFYKNQINTNEVLANQREWIDKQKIRELEDNIKIQALESMVNGQEIERNRIANDLHDSLGGMLSTLKLQYDALQLDHEHLVEDKSFNHINKMIDLACADVRDIARNLKPAALDRMGLKPAIQDLINRYKGSKQVDISLHTSDINGRLKNEDQLHIYRIIQELLHNAIKHSMASEIDIQITGTKDEISLSIEDNGKGFNKEKVKLGLGLDNIKSRVSVLKGELNIDSTPGKGTSVIVHIPNQIKD